VAKKSHASIGDVLNQLRDEFPDITISKIRFLESQGLVDPERTPSGYRKFYPADVERLRFILRQQRENFLPLKVIKERLDEIDANGGFAAPAGSVTADDGDDDPQGRLPLDPATVDALFEETRRAAEAAEGRSATARLVPDDDAPEPVAPALTGVSMSRSELARACGLAEEHIAALQDFGLITPIAGTGERAVYDDDSLAAAKACAGFMQHGIEPRHLRMYRSFADREATLFEQVLLPFRRQRNPEAQAIATDTLGELAGLGRRLRTALLRQAVRNTFNG